MKACAELLVALPLLLAGCDSPTPPPPARTFDAELAASLLDRMDRLVGVLEAGGTAPATASRVLPTPVREAADGPSRAELLARVEQLEQELAALRAAGGGAVAGGFAGTPELRVDRATDVAQRLAAAGDADREVARNYFLWREDDLAAWFGMPSEVVRSDGWVKWYYQVGEQQLSFVLVGGRVTEMKVR